MNSPSPLSPPADNSQSFKEFKAYADAHLLEVEARRQRFQRQAVLCFIMIPFIIVLGLWLLDLISDRLESPLGMPYFILTGVYLLLVSAWLAARPIFRYRRETVIYGNRHVTSSLKELIYANFFPFFGAFKYHNLTDGEDMKTKGVARTKLHGAPHIPSFDEYRTEDWVSGIVNGAKVEFSEAEMLLHNKDKKIGLFRGMVLVIDIDEIDTQLRGQFKGKGAIVVDVKKHALSVQQHYSSYEKLPLPAMWEGQLEAYTTHPDEAAHIFSEEFVRIIMAITELLNETPGQITHRDEKLFWLSSRISSRLLSWFEGIVMQTSGLKGERKKQFAWDADKFTDQLSDSQLSLNKTVEASYFEDKLVVTIPYAYDLFEPNSLFEPALDERDLHLVYDLMQLVIALTQHVADTKDKLSKKN